MKKIKLTFRQDGHITKRTVRYEEIDVETGKPLEIQAAVIGKIYVKKSALGDVAPHELKVTLES